MAPWPSSTLSEVVSKDRPYGSSSTALLIERSQLRNKYGIAFMADYPGDDVRSHRRRFELYRALASTLEAEFADEVVEYFQRARQDAKGSNAA